MRDDSGVLSAALGASELAVLPGVLRNSEPLWMRQGYNQSTHSLR